MFSKITTRRRHGIAAGSARRRALAVETLEGRSLLAVTGFDGGGGVGNGADGGVWNAAGSPAQYAAMAAPAAPSHAASASAGLLGAPLAARGFAWRFGDGFYAQGADASSRVSPFSPQFSAVLVSPSPRGPDAGYAKAYVLPSAEGGSFGCVVVICATSLDGSASQLGQSVALGGVVSQRSTYLSSIDRAFDIQYDAPAQIWRLTPSETLSRLLHDAWIGERRGDAPGTSFGKDTAHLGDRMNAGMGADRDDGPTTGRMDDGDPMRGGISGDLGGETGGFLALSTAGDLAMSSAVANIFAEAAQRAAPSVVSRGEASVKNLVASAIGSDVNNADVAPPVITRTETIGAAATNAASLDSPARSDSATTAPATPRADVDVAAEVPSTTASSTTASSRAASSRAAHRALDAANLGAAAYDASSEQDGDDPDAGPVASDTSSDANRFADADAADATTIHDAGMWDAGMWDAGVWIADEGQGGMIALAASYLPGDIEPAHPAADAWVLENVRPRVDGEFDEPRFESNVGIFQVLDVAAAPPLAGRITELPRHVVTTAVVLPLAEGDVPATEEDSTTEPARVETAAVDQRGLGPHYAVAVAAALAASAGVTLRGRRPLEAVKRIVERARGQVTTGGK